MAVYQCFVDACLDARRIGDADCDNDIDCDDLTLALAQPFAGEDFTGSTYNVGFDVDLDGDNDAADLAEIECVMLAVEPANFEFDGSLNFADSTAFTTAYGNGDPKADLDGSGSLNFGDVSLFLTLYATPECF